MLKEKIIDSATHNFNEEMKMIGLELDVEEEVYTAFHNVLNESIDMALREQAKSIQEAFKERRNSVSKF